VRVAGPKDGIFTYVGESAARIEHALGDGRIALERELARGGPRRFDLLVLDAFSSDAVPMHLLTREAFATYLRHLDGANGILAVNMTNRYVDLTPVVRGLARHYGLAHAFIEASDDGLTWYSHWALLARDPKVLAAGPIAEAAYEDDDARTLLWTDDYSNLLRVLKF
jgi:hypothetical protein